MKAKNLKFLFVFVLVLATVALLVLSSRGKPLTKSDAEIASLNKKYGLVAVESLSINTKQSSSLSYVFDPDVLRVSVFEVFQPETELIVKLKGTEEFSSLDNVFLLKLRSSADPSEIAEQYESISMVSYAEPNFSVGLSEDETTRIGTKTPTLATDSSEKTSDDILVAVIDSGVDTSHKDLRNRVVKGYDFASNDEIPNDNYGHGTHVAGIIANHSTAKIMPIKFADEKNGKISDLAKAINFAVENDADIINLSLGLSEDSTLLKSSIDYAVKNEVYVVAAAGNYNSSDNYYPAAYSNTIAVAGLKNDGDKLPQSNFGTWVDYSVKAQDIFSSMPGNKYGFATGTSEAAPFVSAKIAKFITLTKNPTPANVLARLNRFSTPISEGEFAGLLGRSFK
jgi:subtilisin family serine protease